MKDGNNTPNQKESIQTQEKISKAVKTNETNETNTTNTTNAANAANQKESIQAQEKTSKTVKPITIVKKPTFVPSAEDDPCNAILRD